MLEKQLSLFMHSFEEHISPYVARKSFHSIALLPLMVYSRGVQRHPRRCRI